MIAGLGLSGLGAGFVVAASVAGAQVMPRDTTRRDSLRVRGDTAVVGIPQRPDSSIVPDTTSARVTPDSIQAPLARASTPISTDVGFRYAWDRDAFFASGALTLLDLLERVPGLTALRGGWVAAPMGASYLGVPGRVRVFLDGLEVDALQTREGGTLDLGAVQLWQLEDVAIERGASEVRVYVRTWRVERTTAYTRTDIATGDEETNAYRGFFGRRWTNGMALQVGAQQFSTSASPRSGGAGDALSLFVRTGWARGAWSADAYLQQNRRSADRFEDGTIGGTGAALLSEVEQRDRLAYLRAGYGQADRDGAWAQFVASTRRVNESGEAIDSATALSVGLARDLRDTSRSQAQYMAAAGVGRGGVRLTGHLRARVGNGDVLVSPEARLAVDRRWLSATLLAERAAMARDTAYSRVEALARVSPLARLSFAGAVAWEGGRLRPDANDAGGAGVLEVAPASAVRGEAAVQVGRAWASGGVLYRDPALLRAPQLFSASPARAYAPDRDATGAFAALRGPLWKSIGIDAYGVRWNQQDNYYRPQWQSRAELYLRTNWLSRFPTGEFGFLAAGIHEYRSNALFISRTGAVVTAPQSRVIGTIVELRLQQAVISWQFRNIAGERYSQVPGFAAPRPINFYGVRWEFWN